MPDWGWVVVAGVIVAVLAPITKILADWALHGFARYVSKTIALYAAPDIIEAINGSLGLTDLKDEVAGLSIQFQNLEGQFEVILTDLN